MVFSSVPLYLDPPNWPNHHHQQQQQQGDGGDGSGSSPGLLAGTMAAPPPGGGSIRPGSMTERARLAKIPLPEATLKCPRCDSINTKFCYFNNYSLSQPRHFCKTCRRYWTRGGALRNVPVGGGCRRNKRGSKGRSRSKSPARGEQHNGGTAGGSSSSSVNVTRAGDILGAHLQQQQQQPPGIPFFPPLQNLSGFGTPDLGLHYATGNEIEYPAGMNLSARFADLFRLQQGMTHLPFMSGLDQPTGGLYQFEAGVDEYVGGGTKEFEITGDGVSFHHHHHQHPAAPVNVKLEDNNNNNTNGINFSRNFLGIPGNNNDQFWASTGNNNGYTTSSDLSGYASRLL